MTSEKSSTSPDLFTTERLKLNQTLNAIMPEQLDVIIFTLAPPPGIIPPLPASGGQRVTALLKWSESPTGCRLKQLQQILDQIVSPRTTKPNNSSPIINIRTGTLADAIKKAADYGLHILSSPFHRPFQYMGMSVAEASLAVGVKPKKVGNIIIDSDECQMLLEAEGNFINYVDIQIKKTAPWLPSCPFDSTAILGVLSINPSELELVRQQTHYHTYYDHKRKLKVSVSCSYEGAPLSVGFSSKY